VTGYLVPSNRVRRLVAIAVVLAGYALGAQPPASATPTAASLTRDITIHTLPALSGVRLMIGPQTVVTGPDGTVQATVSKDLDIETGVVPVDREILVGDTVRAKPDRVYAQRDNVIVAFSVDYLTTFSFTRLGVSVPASTVGTLGLKSSVGAVTELTADQPVWLQGSRVVRDSGGVASKDIYYTVERVEVSGLNVVNANQQRIVPRLSQHLEIELLFFNVVVKVRDAFFGFPVGRTVTVRYPSGQTDQRSLSGSGTVRLENLPRGEYQVLVRGGGLKVAHPVAVSRDQPVDLKVFSYFDIALVIFVFLVVVTSLLWFSFHRRLGLRNARPPSAGEQVGPEMAEIGEQVGPEMAEIGEQVGPDMAEIGEPPPVAEDEAVLQPLDPLPVAVPAEALT